MIYQMVPFPITFSDP